MTALDNECAQVKGRGAMEKSPEEESFVIDLSSADRRIIDLSVADLVRILRESGAGILGPILQKNFYKDEVLHFRRRIRVLPAPETAACLDRMNLSKDVAVRLFRD